MIKCDILSMVHKNVDTIIIIYICDVIKLFINKYMMCIRYLPSADNNTLLLLLLLLLYLLLLLLPNYLHRCYRSLGFNIHMHKTKRIFIIMILDKI